MGVCFPRYYIRDSDPSPLRQSHSARLKNDFIAKGNAPNHLFPIGG